MTAVTGTDVLGHAAAYLRDYDIEGVSGLYRDDVILDANVPLWRFQLQGTDAILEWFRDELAHLGQPDVVSSSTHQSDDGIVVELQVEYDAGDGRHLCRELHLLLGDERGIAEHRVYCTGVWDPATIERHRVEGTVVRR
jgi:hypothetical protein